MLKKILITSGLLVSSLFMMAEQNTEAASVDTTPYTYFDDVPLNSSHSSNIYTLYRMGVVNGYGDGSYGTSKNVSREHIVAIMYRLLKDDAEIIRPAKTFKDVPKTYLYYNEITWAYQIGMIDGSGDYFNPKDSMTRSQMSKILVNGFSFKSGTQYKFKDVPTNDWSYEFINALYDNGITQLVDFTYNPKNNVTRGQLASFLVRSLEKEKKYNIGINFVKEVPKKDNLTTNNKVSYESGYGFKWQTEVGAKTLKLNGVNNNGKIVANFVKGNGMSLEGVKIGMTKNELEKSFGSYKVKYISYKEGNYSVESFEDEMFIFKKDKKIVHVFLDKHNNNRVTGILSMNESIYKEKEYYANGNTKLQNDYESLMTLLVNQSRKENNLPSLENSNNKYVSLPRNHSIDMAKNNYFNHESPDKKSTLTSRIKKVNIPKLSYYGENIAYGQETVIHAHEGLMNSLGHRENILSNKFGYVVTGVAFNSKNVPYYTINFYNMYK